MVSHRFGPLSDGVTFRLTEAFRARNRLTGPRFHALLREGFPSSGATVRTTHRLSVTDRMKVLVLISAFGICQMHSLWYIWQVPVMLVVMIHYDFLSYYHPTSRI
jgi:hypothetical protein